MTDRTRYRLILQAVKAGRATNWRQSDNLLMSTTWEFTVGDVDVLLFRCASIHVKPYPPNGNPVIGQKRRTRRLLRALAEHGMVPPHETVERNAWAQLHEATP